ncbi:MAG: hypothetical protein AVDCRST_MAG49-1032 [uncultured Thermomicrobiales bacterium]|uniref:Uncharacterized protein n=1 Tax=uncultured Thermomicrobiales bacterium TaxID=1645740 RepID=A0A6J4U7X8_9BACT|nr:MAG: hypothetical protein AVDCRST_MAG49-1032 [uncultured Thermomicrobiales bacterium]
MTAASRGAPRGRGTATGASAGASWRRGHRCRRGSRDRVAVPSVATSPRPPVPGGPPYAPRRSPGDRWGPRAAGPPPAPAGSVPDPLTSGPGPGRARPPAFPDSPEQSGPALSGIRANAGASPGAPAAGFSRLRA